MITYEEQADRWVDRYHTDKPDHPDWHIWSFSCRKCGSEFAWDKPRNDCLKCDPPTLLKRVPETQVDCVDVPHGLYQGMEMRDGKMVLVTYRLKAGSITEVPNEENHT